MPIHGLVPKRYLSQRIFQRFLTLARFLFG